MCVDLWSFALLTYARPGAEPAFLGLQEQGADVCLLLCGAWLEQLGVALTLERIQALKLIAGPWQMQVVEPLRQVRMKWLAMSQLDKQLSTLRHVIKELELEAERHLMMRLQALTQTWPTSEVVGHQQWMKNLATEGDTNLDHDLLQQLRVVVTGNVGSSY